MLMLMHVLRPACLQLRERPAHRVAVDHRQAQQRCGAEGLQSVAASHLPPDEWATPGVVFVFRVCERSAACAAVPLMLVVPEAAHMAASWHSLAQRLGASAPQRRSALLPGFPAVHSPQKT